MKAKVRYVLPPPTPPVAERHIEVGRFHFVKFGNGLWKNMETGECCGAYEEVLDALYEAHILLNAIAKTSFPTNSLKSIPGSLIMNYMRQATYKVPERES